MSMQEQIRLEKLIIKIAAVDPEMAVYLASDTVMADNVAAALEEMNA